MEPSCLVPVKRFLHPNGLLVLSGDPLQLGAVVQSQHAKQFGLGLSLMERLIRDCSLYTMKNDSKYTVMLKKNFRSHADILEVPNKLFYGGQLQACAKEILISRTDILSRKKNGLAIIFHAVFGEQVKEKQSSSYYNKDEVYMVEVYIRKLLTTFGMHQKDIGVITPYTAQVNKINECLKKHKIKKIDVQSVERFQGKEKVVIIMSTVRGRGKQTGAGVNLGFVADEKRFNVALTRAKAKLIVIGNPNCLNMSNIWKVYIEKCKEIKSYIDTDITTEESELVRRMQRLDTSYVRLRIRKDSHETRK